jgi:flagellar basal-body rod protein FlgF
LVQGLYTAASGMLAASAQENVVSRNLANADTPGYQPLQAQVSEFSPMLVTAMQGPGTGGVVQLLSGGFSYLGTLGATGGGDVVTQTPSLQQNGLIDPVSNPLAAALTGPGYFEIQTPQGPRYTRDGSFTINPRGQLATASGDPVVGTNGGPITVQAGAVLQDGGAVVVGGKVVGHLRVVKASAPNNLVPMNGSLLYDPGNAGITNVAQPGIQAGALEMPKLGMSAMMTSLIEAERAYQSSQSMLMTTDQTVHDAITQVGQALA